MAQSWTLSKPFQWIKKLFKVNTNFRSLSEPESSSWIRKWPTDEFRKVWMHSTLCILWHPNCTLHLLFFSFLDNTHLKTLFRSILVFNQYQQISGDSHTERKDKSTHAAASELRDKGVDYIVVTSMDIGGNETKITGDTSFSCGPGVCPGQDTLPHHICVFLHPHRSL